MSWFSNLMGGGSYQDPAAAASKYYDQVPDYVSKYYDDYINKGKAAGDINAEQFSKMASDPTAFYDSIYNTYKPSAYYQHQSDLMHKTAANTAAAGGYSGTESDIQKQTEQQNALADMDWDKYLQEVLGIQQGGLQGNQQMYNTGFQASNMSAEDLLNMLNAQGGLAFNSAAQKNAYNQANNNSLLGGIGNLAGIGSWLWGNRR